MANPALIGVGSLIELTRKGYKPISVENKDHFAAIGRLVTSFSTEVDAKIRGCIQSQINSGEESVGRIILRDMRSGDALNCLTQIASYRKLPKELLDQISCLSGEISKLRDVRDIVAHRLCWVKADSLAFHNSVSAKSDEQIEVTFYEIAELEEFSDYAKRLGLRISMVDAVLVPVPQATKTRAGLCLFGGMLLTTALTALIQARKIPKNRLEKFQKVSDRTHAAVQAFLKAATQMEEDISDIEFEAYRALREFSGLLILNDAPEGETLHEIPARLRSKRHKSRADRSPAPALQPPSSEE